MSIFTNIANYFGRKTVYQAPTPVPQKKKETPASQAYGLYPEVKKGLLETVYEMESSSGLNKANEKYDLGAYGWMTGLTKTGHTAQALKNIQKDPKIKSKYKVTNIPGWEDVSTPEAAFGHTASALAIAIRDNPKLSLEDIYFKKYNAAPQSDTPKRRQQFRELLAKNGVDSTVKPTAQTAAVIESLPQSGNMAVETIKGLPQGAVDFTKKFVAGGVTRAFGKESAPESFGGALSERKNLFFQDLANLNKKIKDDPNELALNVVMSVSGGGDMIGKANKLGFNADNILKVIKSSEALNVEKAIQAGDIPINKVYKDVTKKILTDEYAAGRISDIAQKLDYFKSGLSETFKKSLNPAGSTMQELIDRGLGIATQEIQKTAQKIATERSIPAISRMLGENRNLLNLAKKDIPELAKKLHISDKVDDVLSVIADGSSKTRKFVTSLKNSPNITEGVKGKLIGPETRYTPLANETIKNEARALVEKNPEEAATAIYKMTEPNAQDVATGIELVGHYQKLGEFEKASDIAMNVAEKLTRAGQTVQAAKMIRYMEPESVLVQANKIIADVGKKTGKKPQLLDETAKDLTDLSQKLKDTTDENLKQEFGDEINSILNGLKQVDFLKQVSTFQTIAQLLNPKTILARNPLGNEIFYRLERLNKYVATPIDWGRSVLTGADRTVTFRTQGQGQFWEGFMRGAKSGWKGVSSYGLTGQYDAYTSSFKGKWNPMTYLEKTLRTTLQGFDVAAYNRGVGNTLGEMGWLRAKNEGLTGQALKTKALEYAKNADNNIQQIASNYGKYITYQDDTVLAKSLGGVKRFLNAGKSFGLGDLTIKYTKTPASLIMRGIDYSPAGFLRSAYMIAEPFWNKTATRNAREIEMAISRAITGTAGLTGMGYYLADKGILTSKPSKDYDVTNLQQQVGVGQYQVNISALKRWVESGFDDKATKLQEGDTMYSYDWAQPVAMSLSLGANANKNVKESGAKITEKGFYSNVPGVVESSVTGAFNTIAEQPVLQGVQKLFGNPQGVVDAMKTIVESTPSSFTPTFLNQIRQYDSNIARETVTNSSIKTAINKAKNRIPGLAETLPIRYNTLGKPSKPYQDPSLFNIFLNPGFLTSYKPTPAAEIVLDIYNNTGDTKQFPRTVPSSLKLFGKDFVLNTKQKSSFQKRIGEKTNVVFTVLAQNEGFKNAPDETKSQMLNAILNKIYDSEKLNALTVTQRQYLIKGLSDKEKESFVKMLSQTSVAN